MGRQGFDLAREALGSRVADVDCDVYDLNPERVGGRFGLVIFLGVLPHVQDPLYVLHRIASVAQDMIMLETHIDLGYLPASPGPLPEIA